MKISVKKKILLLFSSSIFFTVYFFNSTMEKNDTSPTFPINDEIFIENSELSYNYIASKIQCTNYNKSIRHHRSEIEQKAKDYLSHQSIAHRTKECSNYIAQINSLGSVPVTKEENETRIAFSIKVHKEIGILEMFMALYFRPSDAYCIHVDAKASKEVFAAVKGIVKCYNQMFPHSTVFIPRHAIPVFWGRGRSILEADWICYRELHELGNQWNYLTSGAGTELPLVSIQRLRHVLKKHGGNLLMVNTRNTYTERQHDFWEMQR